MHHHHGEAAGYPTGIALIFVLLPVITLSAYLFCALRDRGVWSRWRMAGFTSGIALVLVAVSPPMLNWAHADVRGHMVQHLLLGMFAPLGLVLAAPGTLLLRHVPVGVARRLVGMLGRPPLRWLVHPGTAAVLDIGGMYLLYLTPLFGRMMADPELHLLLHLHFVIAGCLFTWAIAGPDPAPHRPGLGLRLAILLMAMGAHAALGKLMFGLAHPRSTGADLLELQQAAQIMYYGGDLAEVLLAIAFFALWFRGSRQSHV